VNDPTDLPNLTVAPDDVAPAPEQPRRAFVEQVMGMPVSLHVRGPLARLEGEVDAAVRLAIADLHRTEEIFSTYRSGSQISRLRRGELTAADCDPWVREVIDLCDRARQRTGGAFDAYLPDDDGVRRFDPTGLVKGWAVERVVRMLAKALPEHDVLVNAGGDVAVRCRRTDTPDWRLGIEDPADRSRLLATVGLRTGATATSGTAARGAHLLDPATGRPVTALRSVTVVGPDLTWADVHATAAFVLGEAGLDHLASLTDHLSFVVLGDGSTRTVRSEPGPRP
jgi:thiamine biosynthesis lipoprotein